MENLGIGSYHSDFYSAGYEDLETLFNQMISASPITISELKQIGIEKIGHRYRILIKLEEDTGIFPAKPGLKNNWQCCSVNRKTQFGFNMTSLEQWLCELKLDELKDCFIKAGFDDYSFLMIQMKSRYPLTEAILQVIGVNKPGHRNRILGSLIEDTKEKSGIVVENIQTKASCEMCFVF